MADRRGLRNALMVAGIALVLVTLQPRFLYEGGGVKSVAEADHLREMPDHMPYREEFSAGWHGSPLVRYVTTSELTLLPGGGWSHRRSGKGTIGWLSWSAATIAAGVGLIWLARRLRPPTQGNDAAVPLARN